MSPLPGQNHEPILFYFMEKKVTSYYSKSLEISFFIIVVVCGIFVYNRSIVRPMLAFTEIITFLF